MDNNMIDKLKSMLDDPSTMAALSAIMGSMAPQQKKTFEGDASVSEGSGESVTDTTGTASPDSYSNNQADMVMKIQEIMNHANNNSDPRINLLSSLKPYMRTSRSEKMDHAIKLIQIAKIASVFRQK